MILFLYLSYISFASSRRLFISPPPNNLENIFNLQYDDQNANPYKYSAWF